MHKVLVSELQNIVKNILLAVDVSDDHAEIIADTVIYAHVRGKGTHGITRLPVYVNKIKNGLMSSKTELRIIQNTPVIALIDANDGFGQVAAYKGMKLCIEMASQYGIGACGIRNSNNFGVGGYFSEMAVKQRMIGFIASASGPAIAPTGGNKPIFGTNPISVGFPVGEGEMPVIFDMATSEAARGKIRLAESNGEKIPFGWALDKNGYPTEDPREALLGTMIPIGGYKGYGIAMTIDILAGLLTGNPFAGEIKNLNHKSERSRHGHVLAAIDISKLMDFEEYLMKISRMIRKVKECGNPGEIRIPGEKSARMAIENREYVGLNDNMLAIIMKLIEELRIDQKLSVH